MRVCDCTREDIATVDPYSSVGSVEETLLREGVLAVFQGEAFVGLVTASDVVERSHQLVLDCVATRPPVAEDSSVEHAMSLMEAGHHEFLPVFRSGAFRGVVGYRDLATGMAREHEQALRRYLELFQTPDVGVLVIARETGVVLEVNRTVTVLTGRTAEQLRGRLLDSLWDHEAVADPATIDRLRRITPPYSNTPRRVELPLRREDGPPLWVEPTFTPFHHSGRDSLIVSMRDVTARRNLRLQMARIEQFDAMRLLAAGVAHDLNNLLTVMLGNIDLALNHSRPGSKTTQYLAVAAQAAEQTQRLARQLRNFSRDGSPIPAGAELGRLVVESAELFARGRDVRIVTDVSPDLHAAALDPDRLAQVVNNLLINAIQAAQEGGRTVRISAASTQVRGETEAGLLDGSYIELVVADDGPGIAADDLDCIFDLHFTTKEGGSGLGLALVRSIVSAAGGRIQVESAPGRGATFRVQLPVDSR